MTETRGTLLSLLIGVGLTAFFNLQLHARFHNPYPSMTTSLSSPETHLQDVGGLVLGVRRLAADLAWVQTLQYYGTVEGEEHEEESHSLEVSGHFHTHDDAKAYPLFLNYCQRVVGVDPYFTYAYYYGGAVLGWNLSRLNEAEILLKEGLERNPTEWRLGQYLAGLAYQKNHDVANLVIFLESVVQDPECPLLMKALLANIYKKQGVYDKALKMWETIYASGDPDYKRRAVEQTQQIAQLIRARRLTK